MNGWQRLATVIAVPFCVVGFLVGYDDSSATAFIGVPHLQELAKKKTQPEFYRRFWAESDWRERDGFEGCDLSTLTGEPFQQEPVEILVKCDLEQTYRIQQGLFYAAIPAAIMLLLVLTVGWVVAGFRQQKKVAAMGTGD